MATLLNLFCIVVLALIISYVILLVIFPPKPFEPIDVGPKKNGIGVRTLGSSKDCGTSNVRISVAGSKHHMVPMDFGTDKRRKKLGLPTIGDCYYYNLTEEAGLTVYAESKK